MDASLRVVFILRIDRRERMRTFLLAYSHRTWNRSIYLEKRRKEKDIERDRRRRLAIFDASDSCFSKCWRWVSTKTVRSIGKMQGGLGRDAVCVPVMDHLAGF